MLWGIRSLIKAFILRWLGIEQLLSAERAAFTESLTRQRDDFDGALSAVTAQLKADFESRSALVLEAAITASEKISRMVSMQGDSNLKEYVDSCLDLFQEQTVAGLTATDKLSRLVAGQELN